MGSNYLPLFRALERALCTEYLYSVIYLSCPEAAVLNFSNHRSETR